eukprot:1064750_1
MAHLQLCVLLLQIKLLLWKNFKLKTRRWKEIVLMVCFAVFSMLLIGTFRSNVDTQTIPASHPPPQHFVNYLLASDGKIAILHSLPDNDLNTHKLQTLQSSLQNWFTTNQNNLFIITNVTSDSQLDYLIQNQDNDTSVETNNHIKAAIAINKWDTTHYDYTIRLPSSWVPSSSDPFIKSEQETSSTALSETLGLGHSYSQQFIPLQLWMDQFFIRYAKQTTGSNASITELLSLKLQFQPFWTQEHDDDPFMDSMGSLLPFYIVSCFLLPFSYLIKDIVEEKAAKIKEGMRTMGLHILSFWMSWFITYLCIMTVVASIVILVQWKTAMFVHTSFALLYVLYLLYGLSIITFASAMTTFFDKPKTASTVSGFAYFILQMPSYAIKSHLGTVGLGTKMVFSLFCPTGMFLALLSIIQLEQNGTGYTFDNLWDDNIIPAIQNGYCLGYSMIMLVIDIVIYTLLTWFLDQYIRSEYGQKRTIKQICNPLLCTCCCTGKGGDADSFLYKPLSKHQRHARSILSDESDDVLLAPMTLHDVEMKPIQMTQDHHDDNQSAEIHQKISIQIINLSKTYHGHGVSAKSVRAVNNLSMNIYEGECCALLGSNGAGKTTTIGCLTGMIDTTAGTATINGYNINHDMNEIRQFLGVCPQHSVLWPMLSVYEHLYLFANLKNIDKDRIENEIDVLLHEVGLAEKKKSYASTLSGGQKRKLSLAIAFIGDPKVIFLDEPTSGMDPVSRRYTWDLIDKYKQNRCIVLTTHDMTEADAIADRIAIMARGRLRIYGSSLYLKSVCGVGYNLIFTIDCKYFNADDIKSHVKKLTKTIHRLVENAVLFDADRDIESYGDKIDCVSSIEVTFKTTIQDSSLFPLLFNHIDMHLKELRIINYAVSVTTLEEVFLKIAGDTSMYSVPKVQYEDTQSNSYDTTSLTLSTEPHPSTQMEDFQINPDVITALCSFERPELSACSRGGIHIVSVMKKRFRVSIRDFRGIIIQCVMPLLSLLFSLSLVKSFDAVGTSQPTLDLSTTSYQTPLIIPYNYAINTTTESILSHLSADVKTMRIKDINSITEFNQWILNETYRKDPYHIETLYAAMYVDPDAVHESLTLLYDSKATHLLPGLVNVWNQGILNQITSTTHSTLSVQSHPFPLSSMEVEMVDFGVTLMTVILISLSYAFIPTSFAAYIVTERESRVKHQQIIAGLSISSYWIANLLFDLLIFMIPCLLGAIVILLFDIKLFTSSISSLSVLLVFLLFGLSVITLTYLLSFLFNNAQSAQTILGRMYEISGLIFLIIGIMVAQFIPHGTYFWTDLLLFVFRLFPNYAFGEGLFNLTYSQQKATLIESFVDPNANSRVNVFSWDILGRDLCFMFVTTITNLMLIFAVEYVTFSAKWMSYWTRITNRSRYPLQPTLLDHEEDTDIIAEKESIQNGERRYNSSMEIVGLKKIFKSKKNNNVSKVAVNDLYFAVSHSEIFGFLGSNGAGKSTTLKMLTKELVPTEGTAYFRNKHQVNNVLDSNYYAFFYESQMGYCPQNDGLIALLTGREHLELYCRIRGFDMQKTRHFVDILVDSLHLQEFSNATVNTYSGGNRRKLCVGIALVGNPSIVMLDEPSTGIDPISRRFMWNFISNMTRNEVQKRSVLLTTHSMEEAEHLCDRIGIMDKGNLQCLGTAQHLKTKYGDGYELYIKLKENFEIQTKEGLTQYVLHNMWKRLQQVMKEEVNGQINIKLIDDHNVVLRFSIRLSQSNVNSMDFSAIHEEENKHEDDDEDGNQKTFDDIPLSKVFECIERVKEKYEIIEYSISQNTLEQVFLHLVDEEEEDSDDLNQSNRSKCCRS